MGRGTRPDTDAPRSSPCSARSERRRSARDRFAVKATDARAGVMRAGPAAGMFFDRKVKLAAPHRQTEHAWCPRLLRSSSCGSAAAQRRWRREWPLAGRAPVRTGSVSSQRRTTPVRHRARPDRDFPNAPSAMANARSPMDHLPMECGTIGRTAPHELPGQRRSGSAITQR